MKGWTVLFLLIAAGLNAQDRGLYIDLGTAFGIQRVGTSDLKAKPGFMLGVEYWSTGSKGNSWSASAAWNSFSQGDKHKKETYEYVTLRVLPLIWNLGKKQLWYAEFGFFGNYLLLQQFKDGGAVLKQTELSQRPYAGLSAGVGARLGQPGENRLLIGLRNDFGLLGFGSGKPLQFSTLTLFAGLDIIH